MQPRWCFLLFLAGVAVQLSGSLRAPLNLAEVVESSNVIILGTLESLDTSAQTSGEEVRSSLAISAVRVVSGAVQITPIRFEVASDEPLHRLSRGKYGLFFLRNTSNSWEFAQDTYPFLPVSRDALPSSGSPLDRVTTVLGISLERPGELTDNDREQVLDALGSLRTELAGAYLRRAVHSAPPELRLEIARTLVAHNDYAGFEIVLTALKHATAINAPTFYDLAGSLAGLKDARAVPGLATLLDSNVGFLRMNVARALRQTGSTAALQPLSRLLRDSDPQVRYYAVAGMGEITHQDEWTPAMDEFKVHEKKYLDYWRQWAETNLH